MDSRVNLVLGSKRNEMTMFFCFFFVRLYVVQSIVYSIWPWISLFRTQVEVAQRNPVGFLFEPSGRIGQLGAISVDQCKRLNFWPFEACRIQNDFLSSRRGPLDQGAQGRGSSFHSPLPPPALRLPSASPFLTVFVYVHHPFWAVLKNEWHHRCTPCYHSIQANKRTKWRSVDNTTQRAGCTR